MPDRQKTRAPRQVRKTMVPPAAAATARRFARWVEMGCCPVVWHAKLAAPLVTVRFALDWWDSPTAERDLYVLFQQQIDTASLKRRKAGSFFFPISLFSIFLSFLFLFLFLFYFSCFVLISFSCFFFISYFFFFLYLYLYFIFSIFIFYFLLYIYLFHN
jgi:hypothetical protein